MDDFSTLRWWLCQVGSWKKSWLRNTVGCPASPLMFLSAAKVWLSTAEAWQLVQYCPKPMFCIGLVFGAGQSGPQPEPGQPNHPQNQPSCATLLSRTITAAPCLLGSRLIGSTEAQAAAGAGYISLMIMAPSGTGDAEAGNGPWSGRLVFNQA